MASLHAAAADDGHDRSNEDLLISATTPSEYSLPAKILITVTDNDLVDHHVVTLLPKSYTGALALATVQLGQYLDTNPSVELFSLQYGMKSPRGLFVWADIVPREWKDILTNGDELRLIKKGLKSQPRSGPLTDLASFEFCAAFGWDEKITFCGIAPVKKSYMDTKICALTLAKPFLKPAKQSVNQINVQVMVKDTEGNLVETRLDHIVDKDWLDFMTLVKREHSKILFRVRGN